MVIIMFTHTHSVDRITAQSVNSKWLEKRIKNTACKKTNVQSSCIHS